jgi:hypothetical protein
MDEFFEALKNLGKVSINEEFYIEIEDKKILRLLREPTDKTVKVSEKEYRFLLDKGISEYLYDGKIVKKLIVKVGRLFPTLKKHSVGYVFYNDDPYWPKEETVDGGYTWQQ